MSYRDLVRKYLRRNGKVDFLYSLKPDSSILDVGCGNNSPFRTRQILPNCNYTGVDIYNYKQTKPILADKYIVTESENFSDEITKLFASFDAVVSNHNLEHCNDRRATLDAMLNALRPGGRLYLAFPCEQSTGFPQRKGTLNYFDDPTHKLLPPNFSEILSVIESRGFEIQFQQKNYRPLVLFLCGFLFEPLDLTPRFWTVEN